MIKDTQEIKSYVTFVIGDGDLVLLAGALVYSGDIHDAIGINVKGYFNLGDATRSRRDACQLKLSQQVIVLSHCSFTLIHLQ